MERRPFSVACAVALALAPLAVGPSASAEGGKRFTVAMTGADEAPGPGDPDGSGTAVFRINSGTGEICYTLVVHDIVTATAAHIHVAPVGSPGPVVVPLAAPQPAPDGSQTVSACTAVDPDLARAIKQDPEAYYVNVHNAEYPPGAVRGQLG